MDNAFYKKTNQGCHLYDDANTVYAYEQEEQEEVKQQDSGEESSDKATQITSGIKSDEEETKEDNDVR